MGNVLQVRHNIINISDIRTFEGIKGCVNSQGKDVYFVRAIGTNASYLEDINKLDEALLTKMNDGDGFYCRVNFLPKSLMPDDVNYYVKEYQIWIESGRTEFRTRITRGNDYFATTLGNACSKVVELYKSKNSQMSESMIRNFVVKLMFWFDDLFDSKKMGGKTFEWNENKSMKVLAPNVEKLQEYLFYYMLTLVGCDVMLLQGSKDISEEYEEMKLSAGFEVGKPETVFLTEYVWHETSKQKEEHKPVLVIPPRNRAPRKTVPVQNQNGTATVSSANSTNVNNVANVNNSTNVVNRANTAGAISNRAPVIINPTDEREKSFEEIALMASSIVMIAIHDSKGDVIGSGSGIMIGREGYILTNNHVTAGGVSYSVRIEDDDNVYVTDQMIKYNQLLDLAIIRIDRILKPIKIYNGTKKLVRGQKVVAIGSPLGLFNSVSDGIISGFRKIDMVDMIQFTAPTSHGSSGGAVLNMQGEVIGISTAGFSEAQNINLAVGYESINQFIRGFISH